RFGRELRQPSRVAGVRRPGSSGEYPSGIDWKRLDSELVDVDRVQLADRAPIDQNLPVVVHLEVRDLRHRALESEQVDAVEDLDVEVAQQQPQGVSRPEILAAEGVERIVVILIPGVNGGMRFGPDAHAGHSALLRLASAQEVPHDLDGSQTEVYRSVGGRGDGLGLLFELDFDLV